MGMSDDIELSIEIFRSDLDSFEQDYSTEERSSSEKEIGYARRPTHKKTYRVGPVPISLRLDTQGKPIERPYTDIPLQREPGSMIPNNPPPPFTDCNRPFSSVVNDLLVRESGAGYSGGSEYSRETYKGGPTSNPTLIFRLPQPDQQPSRHYSPIAGYDIPAQRDERRSRRSSRRDDGRRMMRSHSFSPPSQPPLPYSPPHHSYSSTNNIPPPQISVNVSRMESDPSMARHHIQPEDTQTPFQLKLPRPKYQPSQSTTSPTCHSTSPKRTRDHGIPSPSRGNCKKERVAFAPVKDEKSLLHRYRPSPQPVPVQNLVSPTDAPSTINVPEGYNIHIRSFGNGIPSVSLSPPAERSHSPPMHSHSPPSRSDYNDHAQRLSPIQAQPTMVVFSPVAYQGTQTPQMDTPSRTGNSDHAQRLSPPQAQPAVVLFGPVAYQGTQTPQMDTPSRTEGSSSTSSESISTSSSSTEVSSSTTEQETPSVPQQRNKCGLFCCYCTIGVFVILSIANFTLGILFILRSVGYIKF